MLKSEGYRMFRGTATIVPKTDKFPIRDVTGDWLYMPDWDCWYVNGRSYPAEIVQNISEDDEEFRYKLRVLRDFVATSENIDEIKKMVAMVVEAAKI